MIFNISTTYVCAHTLSLGPDFKPVLEKVSSLEKSLKIAFF